VTSLSQRIAELSPEKRALLALKMQGLSAEQVKKKSIPRRASPGPAPLLDETAEGLVGSLEYSTELFTAATAERLVAQFARPLHELVATASAPIDETVLLNEAEQSQSLDRATTTASPHDATIHELFAQQAAATPQAVALLWDEQELSYGELERRSNQLAHYLQEWGVGPEVPVALYLDRSPELIVGLLGILKAGGCYVLLDPSYPAERIQFVLNDTGAPVVLIQFHVMKKLPPHNAQVVFLDTGWNAIDVCSDECPPQTVTAQHPAQIMYSSESTGTPTRVLIPHQAIARLACDPSAIDVQPDDRIAQVLNAACDAATVEIWAALLRGAQVFGVPNKIALSPAERVALPAPELSRSDLEAYVAPPAAEGTLAELIPQTQAEELDSEQVAQLLAQLEALSDDEAQVFLSDGTVAY
jgi:non-ribosomal peptide synthetase component F